MKLSLLFSSPVGKEDLRRNYISLCDYVNEQVYLNEMLKGDIKELSKKLHLSIIEKEQIQMNWEDKLKEYVPY